MYTSVRYFLLGMKVFFFLMIRRPPRSTQSRSSAASDVYKRQVHQVARPGHDELDVVHDLEHLLGGMQEILGSFLHGDPAEKQDQLLLPFDARFAHRPGTVAFDAVVDDLDLLRTCLLYTSPSPRDRTRTRMPSSA